jgi:hypothetical protein
MAKSNAQRRTSSFDTLLDYESRSLAHVAGRPESIEAAGHWRGVGFRLGQRRLVSSFDEVMEILPLPAVTAVPGAQPWMLGVANVRGTLLPVVDLKQFLLEGCERLLIEMKLEHEGAVGHAPATLEHGDRLVEDLLKGHRPPSRGRCGVQKTVWEWNRLFGRIYTAPG